MRCYCSICRKTAGTGGFAINLGAVTKLHRRTAVVAHVSRGGTGLMMDAYTAR